MTVSFLLPQWKTLQEAASALDAVAEALNVAPVGTARHKPMQGSHVSSSAGLPNCLMRTFFSGHGGQFVNGFCNLLTLISRLPCTAAAVLTNKSC